MTRAIENQVAASWSALHPFSPEDQVAMAAMRAIVEPNKGKLQGTSARVPFDAIMERVTAPARVIYEDGHVGGIAGCWCRPEGARSQEAILHLHGGWFNWGSAQAYRHLAGHIAAATKIAAFVPDYRLAPEHPFPAASEDILACYVGFAERGFTKVAITGDSAGGTLALELLVYLAANREAGADALVGGALLSPVTDLSLSGESWWTRAAADPYFTQLQATELLRSYLNGHDPADPLASPLYANLKGLAPIRVYVGEDEVLLDDSARLVGRAVEAGVDVRLEVWQGMAHGFLGSVGKITAANELLQLLSEFLIDRFAH